MLGLLKCSVPKHDRGPNRTRLCPEALESRWVPDGAPVPVPDPPPAFLADISYDVAVGQEFAATTGAGVLDNFDLSAFGHVAVTSIVIPGVPTVYDPGEAIAVSGWGTLTVAADGNFTFVPDGAPSGDLTFEYGFSDQTFSSSGDATLCVGGSGSDYGPEDLSTSLAGTLEYHRTSTSPDFSDVFMVYTPPFYSETDAQTHVTSLVYQVFEGGLVHVEDVATVPLSGSDSAGLKSELRDFSFTDGQELVSYIVEVRQAVDAATADITAALGGNYGTSAMKGKIDRWFKGNGTGAEHQAPTQTQVGIIVDTFQAVADNLDNSTITYHNDAEYDGYGWHEDGEVGIGTWYYSGWYGTGSTSDEKFGTLIHELSHINPPGTKDKAYFLPPNLTASTVVWLDTGDYETEVTVTTANLLINADSYAGFLTQYYR